jgi:Domain of unknown function (DUF2017)
MRLRDYGIRRRGDGDYAVRLGREEREILAALPAQLLDAIETADPSTARLFPPAYEDESHEAEYRSLVGEGLVESKVDALSVFERTTQAERLTETELEAWLGALESLRLVLGTQIDVQEEMAFSALDPSEPDAPRKALYGWLSWLQEEAVEALSGSLPQPSGS